MIGELLPERSSFVVVAVAAAKRAASARVRDAMARGDAPEYRDRLACESEVYQELLTWETCR